MRSFSARELLRWACVLPAALIAAMVVVTASGVMSMVVTSMLGTLATPAVPYAIRFALYYLPRPAAFVIGGALVAPRCRVLTAIALTIIASSMSLVIHILGQRAVGVANYTHFAAETAGAILGAACAVMFVRRRPTDESLP